MTWKDIIFFWLLRSVMILYLSLKLFLGRELKSVGVVAHALIPAEAGGFLGIRSQPGLCIEFQDSQHYRDPISKEKESCWQFQCGLESFVCMSVCCAHVLAGTWASRALGKCVSTQAQPPTVWSRRTGRGSGVAFTLSVLCGKDQQCAALDIRCQEV